MKKADLLARIHELEARIVALEARPYYYQPYWVQPYYTRYTPYVTYTGDVPHQWSTSGTDTLTITADPH